MCLAAAVPLVESGTAGYLGQVQPILKVSSFSGVYLEYKLIPRKLSRVAPNVSIACPKRCQRRSLFVRYEVLQVNQSIVSCVSEDWQASLRLLCVTVRWVVSQPSLPQCRSNVQRRRVVLKAVHRGGTVHQLAQHL